MVADVLALRQVALALLNDRDLAPVKGDGVAHALALAEILLATMPQASPERSAIEAVDERLSGFS